MSPGHHQSIHCVAEAAVPAGLSLPAGWYRVNSAKVDVICGGCARWRSGRASGEAYEAAIRAAKLRANERCERCGQVARDLTPIVIRHAVPQDAEGLQMICGRCFREFESA